MFDAEAVFTGWLVGFAAGVLVYAGVVLAFRVESLVWTWLLGCVCGTVFPALGLYFGAMA